MLAVSVPLGAAGQGSVLAGATLQLQVPLGAAALAQASASAVLSLTVVLDAAATARAAAGAALSVGSTTVTLLANGQAIAQAVARLQVLRTWAPAAPRALVAPRVRLSDAGEMPARVASAAAVRGPRGSLANRGARVQTRARR